MRATTRVRLAVATSLALAAGLAGIPAFGQSAADAGRDAPGAGPVAPAVWEPGEVRSIEVGLDEQVYADMVTEYLDTGAKTWIEADVTIDGRTYPRTGMKLKGNSTLFDLTPQTPPTSTSWLIRLDKFVEQDHDGYHRFAVRKNDTPSHLNEALSLRLLEAADVPVGRAFHSSFQVNGEPAELRLVHEDIADEWYTDHFGDDGGTVWKKKFEGDFGYLGEDPAAYEDYYWEPKGGKESEWQPLFGFLDWMNNASDEEFVAQFETRVDAAEFARYLAVEDILRNWDDLDGPGQNGYLRYAPDTGRMSVVAWDHNLAIGGFGGGPPFDSEEEARAALLPGDDVATPAADPPPPRTQWGFPLTQRAFALIPEFVELYRQELTRLDQELVRSGYAETELAALAAPLEASGLITAEQVSTDQERILSVLEQEVTPRDPGQGGGWPPWPPTDPPADPPTEP